MAEQIPCHLEEYYPPFDRWFENRIYPSSEGLTIYFTDITDRKRAERTVQQERDFSNAVLDSLPGVCYLHDAQLGFKRWNKNFERVTGYPPDEISRRSPLDFFTEAERPLVESYIREVLATGLSSVEAQFVSKDGHQTPYYFTGVRTTVLGEVCLLGVGIDLSQRKQAERANVEASERLRLALDAARMGIFDWDVPANRITWSRRHEELWGFAPGEFAGTYEAFASRVHPEDLPAIDVAVAASIANRAPFFKEFRVNVPGEPIRWIAGRGEFTFDPAGRPLRMRGVVVDVTERREAEAALRASEQRFATLVNATTDAIVIIDANGRYEYVNPAACALWGYSRDEFLRLTVADVVVPDLHDQIGAALGAIGRGAAFPREWRLRRKDGSLFVGEANASVLPDGRIIGVTRDITERKHTEERLREYMDALRALTERVHAIREEEGTRIARELHDELGQSLTGLRIDLSWIDRRLRSVSDGEAAAAIRAKISAMARQIDETVRTVRRISSELRPTVLDDLGLVAAIEWQVQEFQQRTGVRCVFSSIAEDVSIASDRATAVYRILLESLTNVARHAQAKEIAVSLAREGDDLVLRVVDDGVGFQGAAAAQDSLGILGMKERAQALGGTVIVGEAGTRGTAVTARIPLADQRSSSVR